MADKIQKCPDCGVSPGALHQKRCDLEQCPNCGGKVLSCPCTAEQKAVRLNWSGFYPGVAECIEFGWFAKLVPGRGWVPCGAEEPDAMEDLNRLMLEAEWSPLEMRYVRKS
ncbi:hypothetical protein VT85_23860 [Planctomyces sp. SH-PL62]|nr:hypothetical protein VT85_23860 [Planctomyces sp. SH-PL62]